MATCVQNYVIKVMCTAIVCSVTLAHSFCRVDVAAFTYLQKETKAPPAHCCVPLRLTQKAFLKPVRAVS